jgi:hypothetical protein
MDRTVKQGAVVTAIGVVTAVPTCLVANSEAAGGANIGLGFVLMVEYALVAVGVVLMLVAWRDSKR